MIVVKYLSNILILAMLMVILPLISKADNCLDCHSGWEEGDKAPSKLYPRDVHFRENLGCSDCHGGDASLQDMDAVRKSKGFKGVPRAEQIPEFCASCHSNPMYMVKHNPSLPVDQLEKYKTSVHGQRLFGKKDTKVANCVSCHSVHNIESPNVPTSTVYSQNVPATCAKCHSNVEYMKEYGISTTQYSDYLKSVHGEELLVKKDNSAPACNSCHGNHGATPPGVTSLSAVCGLCHTQIADNFAQSPHKEAFDAAGYPQCETCHSNHLITQPQIYWVGTSDSSLCMRCHSAGDAGFVAAQKMGNTLESLSVAFSQASLEIDSADRKGMMVTDERFSLTEVRQTLIQTGIALHLFNPGKVVETAQTGIATAHRVYSAGQAKIGEYYFRRRGLGIATLLITLIGIGIYLKIRSIEI